MIEEVNCPYCGGRTTDLWEAVGNPIKAENEGIDYECDSCEKTFHVNVYVSVLTEVKKLEVE